MKKAKPILVCYFSKSWSAYDIEKTIECIKEKSLNNEYHVIGVHDFNTKDSVRFEILKPETYEKTTITNDYPVIPIMFRG